jgi:hypothetical protein
LIGNWLSTDFGIRMRKQFYYLPPLTVFLFLILNHAALYSQQNKHNLFLKITVESNGVQLADAKIIILQNDLPVNLKNEWKGKTVEYAFPLNSGIYIIAFSKPGFVTKKIEIKTKVPPEDSGEDYKWGFTIALFEMEKSNPNPDVLEKPISRIYFNSTQFEFDYDRVYAKKMQEEIGKSTSISAQQKQNLLNDISVRAGIAQLSKNKLEELIQAGKKEEEEKSKNEIKSDSISNTNNVIEKNTRAMELEIQKKKEADSINQRNEIAEKNKHETEIITQNKELSVKKKEEDKRYYENKESKMQSFQKIEEAMAGKEISEKNQINKQSAIDSVKQITEAESLQKMLEIQKDEKIQREEYKRARAEAQVKIQEKKLIKYEGNNSLNGLMNAISEYEQNQKINKLRPNE